MTSDRNSPGRLAPLAPVEVEALRKAVQAAEEILAIAEHHKGAHDFTQIELAVNMVSARQLFEKARVAAAEGGDKDTVLDDLRRALRLNSDLASAWLLRAEIMFRVDLNQYLLEIQECLDEAEAREQFLSQEEKKRLKLLRETFSKKQREAEREGANAERAVERIGVDTDDLTERVGKLQRTEAEAQDTDNDEEFSVLFDGMSDIEPEVEANGALALLAKAEFKEAFARVLRRKGHSKAAEQREKDAQRYREQAESEEESESR